MGWIKSFLERGQPEQLPVRPVVQKRYALHPGWVVSKSDGDRHFLGSGHLVRLYGVHMHECVVVDDRTRLSQETLDDLIHLYPRIDGNYSLPE